MDDTLNLENQEEWRNWLTQNYHTKDHIWLTIRRKNSDKRGISLEEAVEEAICFGWIDDKLRKIDETRFILRFSPRKPKSAWSKINKDRAETLIETGRMTHMGMATIEAAKTSGSWDSAYTSKVQEALPKDLQEALMKTERAWNNFQHFANSYRNMYIHWVNTSKTDETRRTRIQRVVEQSIHSKKSL